MRALLRKLADKGHIAFRSEGARYMYRPVVPKQDAKQSAVQRLVDTFFEGSPASAVVNLLGSEGDELSASDIEAIEAELKKLKRGK